MDDLYDALLALGYHQVDLWGASGGTREALEFLRRHPRMVRAAILEGTAPVSIKNPLTHAAAAQQALDSLFAQCARDVPCHEGFPRLPNEFARLEQLALRRPLRAHVPSGIGARDSIVELTWPMIAEIVRELSYSAPSERTIPFLVHRASLGDYAPLISAGIRSSRGLRQGIRLGFLLSQTCLEDVPRITDAEIVRETAHTYLGDVRVREQRAACRQWIGITPAVGNSTPVRSDIPVFLLSGTIDPVTPAHFAADAARYLSHSVHVIAPGGHVPTGPCVESMERQFLAAPAAPVDTSCVRTMTLPPFRIR
jgi:pimeloyl-ACP methyl ester carboxylesterase